MNQVWSVRTYDSAVVCNQKPNVTLLCTALVHIVLRNERNAVWPAMVMEGGLTSTPAN